MSMGLSDCPDCGGSGEKILNPDWPSGVEPYSEKCSTCGGTGTVGADEQPASGTPLRGPSGGSLRPPNTNGSNDA